LHVVTGRKLYIKSSCTFGPQNTRHIKVNMCDDFRGIAIGSVSIVRRFDSPKIQLKLKLALTLTLTLTVIGDLRTIEPSDYRADTLPLPLYYARYLNTIFSTDSTRY